jgi:hypothetical protein
MSTAGAGTYARGEELHAERKFYFLPALFDGLGAGGNITFVDSRGWYDTDARSNELPETSPDYLQRAIVL